MYPKIKIKGQYIKDLSFENVNSPQIFLMISKKPPAINISVNVSSILLPVKETDDENARIEGDFYEVMLQINVEAKAEKVTAFICELKYCGVFLIEKLENGQHEESFIKEMLLVVAPSIIFPFAREVIARVTASGGFPPLMLDVIDFKVMYENQLSSNQSQHDDTNLN
ncbi:protein-export chaperone SecB [Neoehrlichia mikurensis]|uniref:Protein-export protein SecB n=1 Tax=Neoehrlichia mikurensis TaxID=89586 RepID=A0A9Q9C0N9_9RICK|nr:protein-export chaperone SecB [Neoehrlichia mikurensis]QXK91684.1 protein-export chaperone SecB [Neoehrlichia mikurensis]QXK92895.1 protein-export chaperone SecB [Neoehrlichia mikurensis]QXK93375.1 protein-export chaperone SecB [Neoehrlichia mikurensis]UTO55680.1 protein-export chaperone SecB [Neoehrlichia mikurensis]UTO56598.1 protein-export chaperone SecB [Neoehrlichia mikurensis]